jgi:CheY-like chemotaxis protein
LAEILILHCSTVTGLNNLEQLYFKISFMGSPKRIFLIDDDEDDLFIFHLALRELDVITDCFEDTNSEAALVRLKEGRIPVPDLIFLDWNMPKISGRDCLVLIKQIPAYAQVPIIIYSTSSAQRDKDETMLLGASWFLTKPNSFKELCRSLLCLLSKDWGS